MNSVNLVGRLTKHPEISYTPNTQTAVTKFTIAVNRDRRKEGEPNADFIRITVFGKTAESCNNYLDKGRLVAVSGRIQTGSYKNKDGTTVYTTDIIAERVDFLSSGSGNQNGGQSNYGDPANLPPAMQQAHKGNMPRQANVPPAANMPPAGIQMGFQDMPGDDEPW